MDTADRGGASGRWPGARRLSNRLVARVKTALSNMLQDAEGLWVLESAQGSNERVRSDHPGTNCRSSVRLDRDVSCRGDAAR